MRPPYFCLACKGPLEEVCQESTSSLNAEQFDSQKAGDYFCAGTCAGKRGQSGLRYFWEHELKDALYGKQLSLFEE